MEEKYLIVCLSYAEMLHQGSFFKHNTQFEMSKEDPYPLFVIDAHVQPSKNSFPSK